VTFDGSGGGNGRVERVRVGCERREVQVRVVPLIYTSFKSRSCRLLCFRRLRCGIHPDASIRKSARGGRERGNQPTDPKVRSCSTKGVLPSSL
jgi:hypothetical protein